MIEDYENEDFEGLNKLTRETLAALKSEYEKFDKLSNKNNYEQVKEIYEKVDSLINSYPYKAKQYTSYSVRLEEEHKTKFNNEIKPLYIKLEKEYNDKKHEENRKKLEAEEKKKQQEKEEKEKREKANTDEIIMRIKKVQDKIREFNNLVSSTNMSRDYRYKVLKENSYFQALYLRGYRTATDEDLKRYNDFEELLNKCLIELRIKLKEQEKQKDLDKKYKQDLKNAEEKLSMYNEKINLLLKKIDPYMNIPKVNEEITKVKNKNKELKDIVLYEDLSNYQKVLNEKEKIITYLEKANDFIDININKKEVKEELPKEKVDFSKNSSYSDNFDDDYFSWDPETMYNSDGTYSEEYMRHIAKQLKGRENIVYQQLQQYNEMVRNGEAVPSHMMEESSSARKMGFINIVLISIMVSLIAIASIIIVSFFY